ncbi:phospholipase A1 [Anopheles funestus]|uniref:phospholipase A1 n=1 Tax=Anopheles funestus TaxID=62324 RepID=UPI0020C6A219|nr:phospholipase A1 [Anopheles funestus]XP_049288943.1 phospholipase A1 [Anopheles funestus]
MVLSEGQLALCTVFTLWLGGLPLMYSPAPRGDCDNCCPIREPKDIQFFLFTRENPDNGDTLFVSDKKHLRASRLNRTNPLVIYLHGFSERAPGGSGESSKQMKDALLEADDYNVVLVDWSPLTALPWYVNSVQNGPRVGRYIARFVRFLVMSEFPLEKIHLIGFSLGAEVAGFAGKTLNEWGLKLPRITGLDPAFPLYVFEKASQRLSPKDAEFVDVIHTDGGLLGYPWPLGHVDFYPNGGVPLQPGCAQQELAKNRWLGVFIGCSHARAWQYFAESLTRPQGFLCDRCEPNETTGTGTGRSSRDTANCTMAGNVFMGMYTDRTLRGKFYLSTNPQPPFGKHLMPKEAQQQKRQLQQRKS